MCDIPGCNKCVVIEDEACLISHVIYSNFSFTAGLNGMCFVCFQLNVHGVLPVCVATRVRMITYRNERV